MTTASDQTNRLFMDSVLAEDAGGYPDRVAFIAHEDDWQNLAWQTLVQERRPTVVVDEDALEIIFVPTRRLAPLAWLDRIRGRVLVRVGWRQRGGTHTYEMPVSLSRSRLAQIESPTARVA